MTNKNDGFSFKQLHVSHVDCAMKVGTDGILLGGWADVTTTSEAQLKALDIGTGSGLISLMLAQRCKGELQATAIDIDELACRQAKKNIDNSPWPSSIVVKHVALQPFTQAYKDEDTKFDLIVSNPPYVRNLEKQEIKKNVLAYEPHLALFVEDDDALIFYKKIV